MLNEGRVFTPARILSVLPFVVLSLIYGRPAGSQTIELRDVSSSEHIRLRTVGDERWDGLLKNVSVDSLRLSPCGNCADTSFALTDIRKLEVQRGKRSYAALGILI